MIRTFPLVEVWTQKQIEKTSLEDVIEFIGGEFVEGEGKCGLE